MSSVERSGQLKANRHPHEHPQPRLLGEVVRDHRSARVEGETGRALQVRAQRRPTDHAGLPTNAGLDKEIEGEPLPTLKSLDTEERVIYLGSFSKILAPGLRLGWAVGSTRLIEQLGLLKLAADTQCSTLSMTATSLYLERFDVESHIAVIRATYRPVC